MQIPRKMSAQNVMASISRTLGTRHDSNVKASNEVKFAGEESKDKLYEPKHRQKAFRVMTVVAYVISVSLAAIILSLYYMFIWDPKDHARFAVRAGVKHNLTAKVECLNPTLSTGVELAAVIGIQERTTAKPNVTESLEKEKLVYPPVYLEENQPIERPELEASLNPLPTINPTSAEYQDISVENVEEPLGIEFDSDRLTRR
ncbi:putative transmembrane protein INAFM2 isoform X3 [Fopius arisanus]|uniref:Transmembrane protein INAFM2 isoform X3 n=2 Tax=Fopius arisanus TaxID=64838 RepID=A0A9R1U8C5_9HYME|nr:PREDICTED: putative transmembrane protein INAFM2 isoform X3 [Fopius arisanus]